MRVVVVGVSYVVTTLPVDGFPVEHSTRREVRHGITSSVAGSAFLAARTLAALGAEVYLASPLGEDAEGAIVDAAGFAYGVNTAMCPRLLPRTPRAVVLEDPRGRRQANCDLGDATAARVELDIGALANADLLVLDHTEVGTALVGAAHAAGVPVAVDVGAVDGPPTLEQQALLQADLIVLSDERLRGREEEVLRTWRERTRARLVVLTLGSGGAIAMPAGDEEVVHLPVTVPEPLEEHARAAYLATLAHDVLGRAEPAAQAVANAAAAASATARTGAREAPGEVVVEATAVAAGQVTQAL